MYTLDSCDVNNTSVYSNFCSWMMSKNSMMSNFYSVKANVTRNFLKCIYDGTIKTHDIEHSEHHERCIIDAVDAIDNRYKFFISVEYRKIEHDEIYYFFVNDIMIESGTKRCELLFKALKRRRRVGTGLTENLI